MTGVGIAVACGLFALVVPHARTTIVVLLVIAACAALWAYKAIDIAKRRIPSQLQMQIPIAGNRVTRREAEGLLHLFHDNTEQAELLGATGVKDKILLITHRSKVLLFGPLTLLTLIVVTALVLISQVHRVSGGSGAFGIGLLVVLILGIFMVQNTNLTSAGGRFIVVGIAVLAGVYLLFFLPKSQDATTKSTQHQQAYSATIGWQVYLGIVLAGLIVGLVVYIRWKSFYFVVTNLEAIIIHHYPATLFFIPPRQLSMLLIHTGTIGNNRPFFGTIFNYGSLDMDSGEERDKPFNDIRGIKGPDHVVSIVKDAAKQARGLYGGI